MHQDAGFDGVMKGNHLSVPPRVGIVAPKGHDAESIENRPRIYLFKSGIVKFY
jgi:hypothetical protein